MRIFERIQYTTAVALLTSNCLGYGEYAKYLQYIELSLVLIGAWTEGFRFPQLPFCVVFLVYLIVNTTLGYRMDIFLFLAILFALYCWFKFGESDYSKFKPCGKFRVGYRYFRSKNGNDCSVFYPAAQDGSGEYGVPFLPYGNENVKGLLAVVSQQYPAFKPLSKILLGSMTTIKIPVYRNANPGLAKMQPIIFSHGLTGQRNTYGATFMELASCGYCVFTISHNDRSADYTPRVGLYRNDVPIYTYEVKNLQVSIRETEIGQLAAEIMRPGFLSSIFSEWTNSTLTDQLVLMGHSFGGISVFGAAKLCKQAKAIVGIDPWFYPHSRDEIGAAEN